MKIRYYNRQPWAPPGVDPNILETSLGEDLENRAKHAMDRLIGDPNSLDDNDTATLLVYMEFQRIRVPRQAETAKALMREALLRAAPPEVAQSVRGGELQLAMKESARFDYMRWMIGNLHPWFARMEWEIVEAQRGSVFITTDSPVSFYNPHFAPPTEAGIALAGTIVFFPLSSHYLLIMRHPECRSEHPLKVLDEPEPTDGVIPISFGATWDSEVVTNTNWKLSRLAHHFIVAESEEPLKQCR